MKLFEDNLYL